MVRSASLRQTSLVINKFIPNASLRPLLDPILYSPINLLDAEQLDQYRIRAIFAVLKGLVLRNSLLLGSIYPTLLTFLSHPKYGATVAHGFTTLLQPDDLLTRQNHCQISGLHKQKSFALLVPSITSSFREANKETKPNYLIALSGVLKWIPFEIVVEEVTPLVPLLLQSLDLRGENNVKDAAVGTLMAVLRERPGKVEEHAGSLISRLLANSTSTLQPKKEANVNDPSTITSPLASQTQPPPASVRASSLKCLALVPEKLSLSAVLPYRRQVVKRLTVALDDKKRAVRMEAVKCRGKWLEVDEGDEEDD